MESEREAENLQLELEEKMITNMAAQVQEEQDKSVSRTVHILVDNISM